MKKLLLCLVLIAGFTAVSAQTKFPKKKVDATIVKDVPPVQLDKLINSTIDFVSNVVDYGTIEHNSDGVRNFVFTNNGTDPLVIKSAKGSCGCTVPTWSKEPIAPGATSEIGVKYATSRVGEFKKMITLVTNASKKPVILTIIGKVNPAAKEENVPLRKTEGSPLER